jgi:hypothetical protein
MNWHFSQIVFLVAIITNSASVYAGSKSFSSGDLRMSRSTRIILDRHGYLNTASPASISRHWNAPQLSAPLVSIDSGTANGFGTGAYSYWEIGKDVRSISAKPGGVVLGFFSKFPIRFNTQTNSYDLADWYLNSDDINASRIISNGHGEIISCGGFVNASSPTWVNRYNESNFTFISSMTIPAPQNGVRIISDMAISPAGDVFLAGGMWSFQTYTTTPFLMKIYSDLSLTLNFNFSHTGGVERIEFDSNGFLFAGGYIDNIGEDGPDIWIGKFDTNLNLLKAINRDCNQGSQDLGFGLTTTPNGDVYAVGMSGDLPWIGRFTSDLGFISQSLYANVPADMYGWFVDVVVGGGNVFVTGQRGPILESETDLLMAEYSTSLALKSQNILGVSDGFYDAGRSIVSDGQSHIYIGGFIGATGVSNNNLSGKGWLSVHSFDLGLSSLEEKPLAYPNPFRPTKGDSLMSIVNLPESGTLKLFSVKGELVREIPINGGGASWDVKTTAGDPLSSGVYFGLVDGQGSDKTFKVVVQR